MSRLPITVTSLMMVLVAGAATAQDEVVWRTQGVTKTEIVLGNHTDLSSFVATAGIASTNAFRMRLDESNAAGSIHGRKIRFSSRTRGIGFEGCAGRQQAHQSRPNLRHGRGARRRPEQHSIHDPVQGWRAQPVRTRWRGRCTSRSSPEVLHVLTISTRCARACGTWSRRKQKAVCVMYRTTTVRDPGRRDGADDGAEHEGRGEHDP